MEQQSALVREYLQLLADKDLEIARLKRQIEELRDAVQALRRETVKFPDNRPDSRLIVSREWR